MLVAAALHGEEGEKGGRGVGADYLLAFPSLGCSELAATPSLTLIAFSPALSSFLSSLSVKSSCDEQETTRALTDWTEEDEETKGGAEARIFIME